MTQISPIYLNFVRRSINIWLKRTAQLGEAQLKSLNKEFPNLKRVVEHALTVAEIQTEETAVLVKQSYLLIERYGRWASWLPLIDLAINECIVDNPLLLFDLLIQKGKFLRLYGLIDQATATHQEAKKIAEKLNDRHILAEALYNLCVDNRANRIYDLAQNYGQQSLSIYKKINGSQESLASVLNELGLIVLELGNQENLIIAEERLRESIAYGKSKIQPTLLARTMINLAFTLQYQNKLDDALKVYRDAESILATTDSELDKSRLFNSLGTLFFQLKKWKDAEASFRTAYSKIVAQSGDIYMQASLNQNLGNVLLKQGRAKEAEAFLREGIKLWDQVNDLVWLANALGTLGEALAAQKQFENAILNYDKAIAIFDTMATPNERVERLKEEFESEKRKVILEKTKQLQNENMEFA